MRPQLVAIHLLLLIGGGLLSSCGLNSSIWTKETVRYPHNHRETRIVVIGKPQFDVAEEGPVFIQGVDVSQRWTSVSIQGVEDKRCAKFPWPDTAPDPRKLDATSPWRFELLYEKFSMYGVDYSGAEVLRAHLGQRLIFDASICEVHHRSMTRVVDRVDEFGDRSPPMNFLIMRKTRFPHTGTDYPACQYIPNLVWRCPECAEFGKRYGWKYLKDAPFK